MRRSGSGQSCRRVAATFGPRRLHGCESGWQRYSNNGRGGRPKAQGRQQGAGLWSPSRTGCSGAGGGRPHVTTAGSCLANSAGRGREVQPRDGVEPASARTALTHKKGPCTPASRIVLMLAPPPAALADLSGPHRSAGGLVFIDEDLGQDQHGAAAGLVPERRPSARQGATMVHWKTPDVRRGAAIAIDAPCVIDGPINGRKLSPPTSSKFLLPTLAPGRHRHHGQSGGRTRGVRCANAIRSVGAHRLLLPALLAPTSTRSSRHSQKLKGAAAARLARRTLEATWASDRRLIGPLSRPTECAQLPHKTPAMRHLNRTGSRAISHLTESNWGFTRSPKQ